MYGVRESKGGNESVERMLRRFKRVTESAGLLAEIKKRRSFEKPSETKRRKRKDAIRRAKQEAVAPRRRKKRSFR